MNKKQIYLFAFIFLIASVIITIGLYYLGKMFPGQEYYNPLGLIVGFGPLLTALVFILVNKNDKFSDVALKKFNVLPLMKILAIFVFIYVLEYMLYSVFGFVEFGFTNIKWQFYNTEFRYLVYFFLAFLIPFVYTGIGEELGWRGYLLYKMKGLNWGELVIVLNLVWTFWHLPLILYGVMGGFENFAIDFFMFTIRTFELGIVLLYIRLKTGSVIPAMIIHGFINFFRGNIIHTFFIRNEFPDWSKLIIICVLLPFAIHYYKKGKKLYQNFTNTVVNPAGPDLQSEPLARNKG